MFEWLENIVAKTNSKGVPIPMLRDHGVASVSFTMLVVSFINMMYVVDASKSSDSIKYSLALFTICGAQYFGKKWQIRNILGKTDISVDGNKESWYVYFMRGNS